MYTNPAIRSGHIQKKLLWMAVWSERPESVVISSELIEKLKGSDMKRSGPVGQRECISRAHWSVESDSRLITVRAWMAFVSEGHG